MNEIEEKLVLENSLDQLRRDARILSENLADKKREVAMIISLREQNEARLDETNQQLTNLLNTIAGEKLAWLQEKSAEQKKLEDRNAEIDRIVAIESELQKRHAMLNQKEEDLNTILATDRAVLLEVEQGKTAIEVKERELDEREQILAEGTVAFDGEKAEVKKRLLDVIKKIENI